MLSAVSSPYNRNMSAHSQHPGPATAHTATFTWRSAPLSPLVPAKGGSPGKDHAFRSISQIAALSKMGPQSWIASTATVLRFRTSPLMLGQTKRATQSDGAGNQIAAQSNSHGLQGHLGLASSTPGRTSRLILAWSQLLAIRSSSSFLGSVCNGGQLDYLVIDLPPGNRWTLRSR